MLKVYKASAGSGKTFRLVAEYLKLIFQNEFNYRHILAVTFTNKATAEMKERVITQLYKISRNPEDSSYARLISSETGMPAEEMKSRASEALRNILHDYNRFSVSTIDKFTQKVIKSFNRELGVAPSYDLELDNDVLIQEAADRLILRAGADKKLKKWLTRFGNNRISESKSSELRGDILKLGNELFKEKFQEYFATNKGFYGKKSLKAYRKIPRKITRDFDSRMAEYGKKGLNILAGNNIQPEDFKGKSRSVANVFSKLVSRNYAFGVATERARTDINEWATKSHDVGIITLAQNELMPLLDIAMDFYQRESASYYTARLILSNLYTLGVLNDLQLEIENLAHEKGVLLLSDSNLLLKKIIAGSDSPFIYEKTGNTYSHFMLDEFQDTSAMQWDNFRPLIENSLAEGKTNLAVGDVKQSIYRWRNSDWDILANKLETQFDSQQIKIFDLKQNWRSETNIITFNNLIVQEMVDQAALKFNSEKEKGGATEYSGRFKKLYAGAGQLCGKDSQQNKGFVRVNFIDKKEDDDYKETALAKLLEQVRELQDSGYRGKDIAILVRRNNEGRDIVRFFLETAEKPENKNYNLEIISNDSLFLNSSPGVNFVIQFINHLVNPDDKIVKANLLNEYNIYIRPALGKKGKDFLPFSGNTTGKNTEEPGRQLDGEFEGEFETLFGQAIQNLKNQILSTSVDETIITVCRVFNLFGSAADLPFLQGLIDQASQLKAATTNDLSGFLKWWGEKGYKLSVNVNDETDAIRLLTIHKSKGLEYKIVLIPFFDWPVLWESNKNPLIWCEPESAPFNHLPLVPVKAGDEMSRSIFNKDYLQEVFSTYVDNLNLVYVAFTRAVSALIITAPVDLNSKVKPKVSNLLYDSVSNIVNTGKIAGESDEAGMTFRFGELMPGDTKEDKTSGGIILSEYVFNDFNSRLKLRTQTEDFFSEPVFSGRNFGILVHEILSQVESTADIEKACRRALNQQKIRPNDYPGLFSWIKEHIGLDEVKDWFSGEYKVLNERNLLSSDGVHRPDRVMAKGNEAIVVDYKLGSSDKKAYTRQVTLYASELKKTGFEKVTGFLWFIAQNKVEKVCQL
jgi:ATP-dependent helicase/nuclease subunit A